MNDELLIMKPYSIKDRSFLFALSVIRLSNQLRKENNEFVLSRQVMRSGTAVGALIREAQNAESDKDFIHKMAIAQKECDETAYWLELIKQSDFIIEQEQLSTVHQEATELLRIIRTIILNKKQNMKTKS